jgi:hypothetical protein
MPADGDRFPAKNRTRTPDPPAASAAGDHARDSAAPEARDHARERLFHTGRRSANLGRKPDPLATPKLGDSRPGLLDKATELNDGYTGSMVPRVHDAVKEAKARLKKAAPLLSGP